MKSPKSADHSARHASTRASMAAGLGLLAASIPAWATDVVTNQGQVCMQKVFGTPVTSSNRLNCTANDIRISRAVSASPSSCTKGTKFDLTATFETIVTANARYDAGFFFRTDGGPNARGDGATASGVCTQSGLRAPNPPNPPALNLDGDTSGDLNSGTYLVTFTIPDVACEDTNNNGMLNLPNCTSWHSNQGTFSSLTDPFTFNPDTKSKCVCDDTFEVPVEVEAATLSVDKSANPTQVPEPGGTVTFTVQVTNTASVESVVISSIIDNVFGDLGTNAAGFTKNDCPDLIGDTLAAGESASCEFDAGIAGNAGGRHTNTVTVAVTQPSTNQTIEGSDDADVDFTDVYTAPTVSKQALATSNCQVDATFGVVVNNNSTIDDLTVNALTDDKFGNITVAHAAGGGFGQVVSTTCGLTSGNSTIGPLGSFSCSFVGRITSTSCDFSHTNTVTAGVTDDDGTQTAPTDDAEIVIDATP